MVENEYMPKEPLMIEHNSRQLGNYRLVRLIGQGGFADVYLGEHIHLRTQAAIKVLQMRLGANTIQSFLGEARTIAHLVHPNIIRVLDFGVQNNIPFLVMDYAPRGTFRQRFLQGRPRGLSGLIPLIKQTAEALQYAHDNNFIHRDVKPENMLLGPNSEILLSDFGLALMTHSSISRTKMETAGTAAYMAPEQMQGRPKPASDQYALGVITYEWLTGVCPFNGSVFEIASQQSQGLPPSLQGKFPDITPQIEQVIFTALNKDPLRRYPNIKDFAQALEQAYTDEQAQSQTNIAKMHTFDAAAFVRENKVNDTDKRSSWDKASLPGVSGVLPTVDQTLLLNGPNQWSNKDAFSQKDISTNRFQEFNRSPLFDTVNTDLGQGRRPNQTGRMRALPAPNAESNPQTRRLLPPGPGKEEMQQPESKTRSGKLAPIPSYEEYMNRAQQNRQNSFSSPPLPTNFQQGNGQNSTRLPDSEPSKIVLPPLLEPEELRIQPPASLDQQASPNMSMPMADNGGPFSTPDYALLEQQFSGFAVSPSFLEGDVSQAASGSERSTSTLSGQRARERGQLESWGPNRLMLLILAIIIILAMLLGIVYLNRPKSTQNSTISATATAANGTARSEATREPGTKSVNPYPPYSGTLMLNDALTQNNNGWLEGAADGGSCRFAASSYQIYATLTTPPAVCFASATNFSDFTYEISMKFSTVGLKYSGGGIAFRANVADDSFYFFEILDSKNYTLQSCINHVCTPLAGFPNNTQQLAFIRVGDGAENKIAVVVTGDSYTFYVNDQLVTKYTATNGTLNANGAIGVMATEGYDVVSNVQQPTTALFNDAYVWS
jgi:serine/threonine protein kinase